jgi:hypothetical protein|tara:strand:+ start:499 stop:1101 length:603 start_codon:yes stop_codon:yes gene_type:complete
MKKFKIETPCLIDKLKPHLKIKKQLISLLKKADFDFLESKNDYFGDLIHRLDWNNSTNFSRKWVKFLQPYLHKHLKNFANVLGYQDIRFINLWFQQYNQKGKHGWHIHGDNYTGVYYVKLSNKSAKTELINPFSQNEKIIIDAKEGDIVIFPSYIIHRAPTQKEKINKIIISFNINFELINPNLFKTIDNLKGKNTNEYI